MTPFTVLKAPAARLDRANVDTDQIIPARFLRKPRSAGYQHFLFADLPDVRAALGNAEILFAGENFGCGSSREGAVYALADAGLRCIVAPSFGDIFAGNAAQNGVLTIALSDAMDLSRPLRPGATMIVDLPAQQLQLPDGTVREFGIDPFRKRCLLEGLDDIGLTLEHAADIAAWEAQDGCARPWAIPPPP